MAAILNFNMAATQVNVGVVLYYITLQLATLDVLVNKN